MLSAGEGLVEVAQGAAGSAVTRLSARSPLKLVPTRGRGRAAWVVVTSYGGGLVDGDRLRLRAQVGKNAALYLTNQASTKVYPGQAAQEIEAEVEHGGRLISAPEPVVCFAGARYRQRATVRLAATASLVWLDALTAGRVARGERWSLERFSAQTRIERAGARLVRDGLLLDPAHGALAERLARFEALATLLVFGPACASLRGHVLASASPARRGAAVLVAPSPIGGDGAVVRVAAESAELLAQALRGLLDPVVALLGDDPFCRKGSLVWDAAMT